jgi:hypothetical protein
MQYLIKIIVLYISPTCKASWRVLNILSVILHRFEPLVELVGASDSILTTFFITCFGYLNMVSKLILRL